ncbi:uroporphyrinogen-III synthase [Aureisphaera galaxeae]|uniref:uroporphyrinogen-III synthase n=1 Tax=Aureisphaera galaxeae TaxID=1538023 RepID=UPI00234FD992|nr:uroporphyrinogen-III synthase [Aureisphaera galaxeae]MDC8002439.1 uroporphyrinogen-III synthase [Aureisphaera galaxeae]
MKTILSTKRLSLSQKELLLNAGVSFVEYDAIEIAPIQFEAPAQVENAIVTSMNGTKSIFPSETSVSNWFCVGPTSSTFLKENGQNVVKTAENSSEMADFIVKNHKNDTFFYFCGAQRRDELPERLKSEKIDFFEVKTYKTEQKPHKFDQKWDGILFFSPSGVQSFVSENKIKDATAFCIGETTASEAQKHTRNVIIANSTRIESVIAKAVKTLQYDPD